MLGSAQAPQQLQDLLSRLVQVRTGLGKRLE
jgi:hypothetical protein